MASIITMGMRQKGDGSKKGTMKISHILLNDGGG